MKRKNFLSYCLLLVLITSGACVARGQSSEDSLRRRFVKSREQSEIKAKGGAGFIMSADLHIWVKKDEWKNGKYLFVWTPEGKWSEEIALADYKRKRRGDGTQFWQLRTPEPENPAIAELDQLIRSGLAPLPKEDEKLERMKVTGTAAPAVECVRLSRHRSAGSTYCFDTNTNDLIEVNSGHDPNDIESKVDRQELSNFREWSRKRIPSLLRGYNGEHPVLEVQLQSIDPLPQVPADFFVKPPEATSWADCGGHGVWTLKEHVQPDYPLSARTGRWHGTVTIRAIIGEDGRLSNLEAIRSPRPELTQSALRAVSQWSYEKASECRESMGRSETFIDVIYSLRP